MQKRLPCLRGVEISTAHGCRSPSQYCIRGNLLAFPSACCYRGSPPILKQCVPLGPSQTGCYHSDVIQPPQPGLPRDLRTVFLDRDGILNQKMPEDHYVTRWDEFHVLPGVAAALRRLNNAGLRVVVVTNQRGIARGLYTIADVEAIHQAFQQTLASEGARIDAFFICPHDRNQCNCRKPLPGLFQQAVARFPSITPATSVMIGDSLSDIEFGNRLGMATIFITGVPDPRNDQRRKSENSRAAALADWQFPSFEKAVDALLTHKVPAGSQPTLKTE